MIAHCPGIGDWSECGQHSCASLSTPVLSGEGQTVPVVFTSSIRLLWLSGGCDFAITTWKLGGDKEENINGS